jgi:hypothetical protein
MSADSPPGAVPPGPGQHWGPPPSALTPPIGFGHPARWPGYAALTIALVALAVGVAAWFRPAKHDTQPPPNPTYTQQQIADAKAKVCAAVGKLDRAVSVGNAQPKGPDPLVASINTTLAEEPATPADLAAAVRNEANTLAEVVIGYEDGLGTFDPELKPIVDANSAAADTVRQLCK